MLIFIFILTGKHDDRQWKIRVGVFPYLGEIFGRNIYIYIKKWLYIGTLRINHGFLGVAKSVGSKMWAEEKLGCRAGKFEIFHQMDMSNMLKHQQWISCLLLVSSFHAPVSHEYVGRFSSKWFRSQKVGDMEESPKLLSFPVWLVVYHVDNLVV